MKCLGLMSKVLFFLYYKLTQKPNLKAKLLNVKRSKVKISTILKWFYFISPNTFQIGKSKATCLFLGTVSVLANDHFLRKKVSWKNSQPAGANDSRRLKVVEVPVWLILVYWVSPVT